MNDLQNSSTSSLKAIRQALRWRLISLLLERPRTGWLSEVEALAAETDDKNLREAAKSAADASEGTYLLMFGESGFVSPREVTYRPMEDPGQILAHLAEFYKSFAFKPKAEDPSDHIAVESGFIGYLWLKEASALSAGKLELAELTCSARNRFIENHFAVIARPWSERVMDTVLSYMTATAKALLECCNEPNSLKPKA